MQCACAVLSCVACPALQYFSTFSHNRHDFREKKTKVTEHKMCVLIFSTNLSETFLIVPRIGRDIIKNVYRSAACTVPVIVIRV
jgi:hypothetical protein